MDNFSIFHNWNFTEGYIIRWTRRWTYYIQSFSSDSDSYEVYYGEVEVLSKELAQLLFELLQGKYELFEVEGYGE